MAIFAVSLDPKDVQDNNRLMIYDVRDNSFEGVRKFIIELYSDVIEESIDILCLESGSVYYATFITEEDDHKKLHWNLAASHVFIV